MDKVFTLLWGFTLEAGWVLAWCAATQPNVRNAAILGIGVGIIGAIALLGIFHA